MKNLYVQSFTEYLQCQTNSICLASCPALYNEVSIAFRVFLDRY